MYATISTAAFLALVSAVSAQTAGFDPITKPTKDEAVAACSTYTVTWDYTDAYPGTVSIQLLEGATSTTLQLGAVIASKIVLLGQKVESRLLTHLQQAALTTPRVSTRGLWTAASVTKPPTA